MQKLFGALTIAVILMLLPINLLAEPALQAKSTGSMVDEVEEGRIRYVPDEYPTIQAAINACVDSDTVMVSPGLYRESIDFLGKNILVTSSDGPEVTTIQGIYRSRAVVYFQSREPKGAELRGFTVTFGQKSGIYCSESSPTITQNILVGNYSNYPEDGGAIDLNNTFGSMIRHNTIVDNHANRFGAAIQIEQGYYDTVAYNIIVKNIGVDVIYCIGTQALIHNNIIDCNESEGNGISNSDTLLLRVLSNIIIGARECGVYAANHGRAYVGFNCFDHCARPYCGDGIIEGPGNFEGNPLLTPDLRIPPSSPCLDAGYPAQFEPNHYWLDPDGTRNDIGVFPVYQVAHENTYVYQQIQPAMDAVTDGDFVYVHRGEYRGPLRFNGKRINVSSANGPENTFIAPTLEPSAVVYFANHEPKGAALSGFTIRLGGITGIYCDGSSPTITNNIISENSSRVADVGAGIDLNGTFNSVIRNNVFTHNAAYRYGAGIYANDCLHDTISYNLFESNEGKGMIECQRCTMAIYNNTLDCRSTLGHGILNSQSGSVDCRNNIVINVEEYGLYAGSGGYMTADYNDVYHCGYGPFGGEGILIGLHNIQRDPLFTDYYRLSERSPCINTGDPNPFFNDPDGTRNDMGWKYFGAPLLREAFVRNEISNLPGHFELDQNYPNPFNASSTIKYALAEESQVHIEVYDILGRCVAHLVDTRQPAGYYQVTWNAEGFSSGAYFYKLQTDNFTETKKMTLLK